MEASHRRVNSAETAGRQAGRQAGGALGSGRDGLSKQRTMPC